jgi:hypothetical protein
MNHKSFNILLFFLFFIPISVNASTFNGKTTTIRYSGIDNKPRISLQTPTKNSCNNNWYYFESDDASLFSLISSVAQDAQNLGKSVTIYGTGSCDGLGIESINAFDVKKI